MSYQEKRAIVSLVNSIVVTGLYSAVMLQRYPDASPYSVEVFHYWGAFFLILIPVSIVANIVIDIVFTILSSIAVKEMASSITDERDKLIELRATRISLYTFAVGVLLAMGSLVVDRPPTTMFILLIGAGVVSAITRDISQFYFYRRGS